LKPVTLSNTHKTSHAATRCDSANNHLLDDANHLKIPVHFRMLSTDYTALFIASALASPQSESADYEFLVYG